MATISNAVGGQGTLDADVQRFHERVSPDPDLAPYFDGMDMRRIIARQIALFALVVEGPARCNVARK